MSTPEKVLSPKTLRTLKKGELVKHSGMLCVVIRFLRRTRIGVVLLGPDNRQFTVHRHKLVKKQALLSVARAEFKTARKGIRETPEFIFDRAFAQARSGARGGY